ncbi:MAG: hypothetical protein MUF49_20565 [Oculatellaceae cyanobacterium Prado106]|jgi:hypothetical protein|nr:hypothetical protein [Oculatellaceae cyanobacterium Prado106]
MHLPTSSPSNFQQEPFQSGLQSGQIVYLEQGDTRLYADVIQVVQERQLCWARPLALLMTQPADFPEDSLSSEPETQSGVEAGRSPTFPHIFRPKEGCENIALYDLRQGSDLLMPLSLFHIALDTEVIPVLAQLGQPKQEAVSSSSESQITHRLLQDFIGQVWRSRPDI